MPGSENQVVKVRLLRLWRRNSKKVELLLPEKLDCCLAANYKIIKVEFLLPGMSGHSKWKTIRHKKETTDKKRGQLFAKLLNSIKIAAKDESNPDFNPRLRTAIEKAKEAQVSQENIERALKQSDNKNLEEIIIEVYGPAGSALIVEAITDNKNRTISEIKNILNKKGAKFAEPGSVRWAFLAPSYKNNTSWQPKFKQELGTEDKQKLNELIGALEEYDDVQKVFTNT